MENLSFTDLTFLMFVIPGFIVVWTHNHFSGAKRSGDFEYLGLSFFWGMFLFLLIALLTNIDKSLIKTFSNSFTVGFGLSLFAPILGWFGALLGWTKWFPKLINFISPKNYLKKLK